MAIVDCRVSLVEEAGTIQEIAEARALPAAVRAYKLASRCRTKSLFALPIMRVALERIIVPATRFRGSALPQ